MDFQHFYSIFVTICNFSLVQLYEKDFQSVNYVALTAGYFYFTKQFESIMINNFKVPRRRPHALVFNDNLPKEQVQKSMTYLERLVLSMRNHICNASILFIIVYHTLQMNVEPPKRYPDLYAVVNNAFSFAAFVVACVYAHFMMW